MSEQPCNAADPVGRALASLDRGMRTVPVTPDQSALGRRHRLLLIGLSALALAGTILALVGATLARGTLFAFDRTILLSMREPGATPAAMMVPEGPAWLKQVMIDVTALGGTTVLPLVVAITAGFLLLQRHRLTAGLLLAGSISGSLAVALAKQLVGRTRPAVIDHLVSIDTASFPSGHSANSAIIYLTLAILLCQIVTVRAQRLYLMGTAIALVVLIGCSRIYLGVHWPSDVFAGWSFGTLWAIAWWAIGAWLRERYGRGGVAGTP